MKPLCIELLEEFKTKELTKLTYLVSCRYFNSDDYVVKLLDVLKKSVLNKGDFTDSLKCKVYEKVFSKKVRGKVLNEAQKKLFNKKLSELLSLAERFIVIEALEEHPAYRNDLLYKKILEKRQSNLFERRIEKAKKKLETHGKRKEKYHYYHQYITERNQLDSLHLKGQLSKKDNSTELIQAIDIDFVVKKLRSYLTLLSLKGKTTRDYHASNLSIEVIMAILREIPEYAAEPLISIFLATIDLVKLTTLNTAEDQEKTAKEEEVTEETAAEEKEEDPNATHHNLLELLCENTDIFVQEDLNELYEAISEKIEFRLKEIGTVKEDTKAAYYELLELLYKNAEVIDKKDLCGLYVTASNICTAGIKVGQFDYQDYFAVFKAMDEKDIMIEGGFVPPNKLKNAINAACRVGEFDWAAKIIEIYKPSIEKSVRKSVYHFNMGVFNFHQKKYEEALSHFDQYETVNSMYDLNRRVIRMKACYEFDEAYNKYTMITFESARSYFRSNARLNYGNSQSYQNFMDILIGIYLIRYPNIANTTPEKRKKILEQRGEKLKKREEELNNQELNADKEWLSKKITDLYEELGIKTKSRPTQAQDDFK